MVELKGRERIGKEKERKGKKKNIYSQKFHNCRTKCGLAVQNHGVFFYLDLKKKIQYLDFKAYIEFQHLKCVGSLVFFGGCLLVICLQNSRIGAHVFNTDICIITILP